MNLPAHIYLDEHNIPYERKSFPPETEKGAANVAHVLGFSERQAVKTLIFQVDTGERVLVMLGGDQNAISGNLKKAIGSRDIRMAEAEIVRETTGYVIGSIPAFGWQPPGFRSFLEASLVNEPILGTGAGEWGEEIMITPQNLMRASNAIVVNLTDRETPVTQVSMEIPPTIRLYLQDDHCFETQAIILAIREKGMAFDKTCFHPGGGGQPPDSGRLHLQNGENIEIESANADSDEIIWHVTKTNPPLEAIGGTVQLVLHKERRLTLMRYHTVLHVLNTIALRDYGGWITGVQIGMDYSRIDFKLEKFSPAISVELEAKVNLVLEGNHALKSYTISDEEFRQRGDLLRTLDARPPISHGQVRVVEIEGFDAQACGGTHMRNTNEVGRFSIFRMDNKGRNNKRFYVRLDPV